jgi:hypothetical protein
MLEWPYSGRGLRWARWAGVTCLIGIISLFASRESSAFIHPDRSPYHHFVLCESSFPKSVSVSNFPENIERHALISKPRVLFGRQSAGSAFKEAILVAIDESPWPESMFRKCAEHKIKMGIITLTTVFYLV